jgi:hypothetical protein
VALTNRCDLEREISVHGIRVRQAVVA